MRISKNTVRPKRLIFQVSGPKDIFNRLSTEGSLLLSETFLSFVDLMRPGIPPKAPILMEITGVIPSEEEQADIDEAIWLHYRLRMTNTAREIKACQVKILWFLVCTILSSVFLYLSNSHTNEVVIQYLSIPCWFFGYRLLTFPLQDLLPLYRELRWYRRLAAMKLVFTAAPMTDIPDKLADSVKKENAQYYEEAITGIRSNSLLQRFYKADGTLALCCHADSPEQLLRPCSVPGSELISEDLASFLKQAEPFINPGKPIELGIFADCLSSSEKQSILSAVKNYFELYCQDAVGELRASRNRIFSYAFGLLVSSIVLYNFGTTAGTAAHEFMLIVFWFFADFLVEFILLGRSDAKSIMKVRRHLQTMKVFFR